MTTLTLLPDSLAVVPILVNTGAALLPAAVAALASAVALIFKPRELFRVCRAKPHVPLILLLVVLGGFGLIRWFAGGEDAPQAGRQAVVASAGTGNASQSDWTQVALQLIREESRRGRVQAETAPVVADATRAAEQSLIYRGDSTRIGYDGGGSPLDLSLDWEYHAEDFSMVISSPLPHGGRVFGASTVLDPPNTFGAVFMLDVETGERIWQVDTLPSGDDLRGFFSSPAVTADGRRLIIGQGLHDDADCELICIDTETGEIVWTVSTPIHIESSPAISGDIVVVGAGAIEVGPDRKPEGPVDGRGNPGYVFAVRISTGEELWQYQVNDPESSPAIDGDVVFIGSGVNGNAVVALRLKETDEELAEQGLDRLLWRTETPYPAVGAVTLYDDLVLIGCGNSDFVFAAPDPAGLVLALDRETGEERWRLDLPDSVLGSIAVLDGKAVAPVRSGEHEGRRTGRVVAFDLERNGELIWEHSLRRNALMLGGVSLTPSHVYALSSDGYLLVLDAETGELVEEHYANQTGRPGELGLTIGSPFVSGGRVFVGTETGGLRAYEGTVGP
ncbi:MAG: PQQ-binding-like beta-propeller repeat protein [Verrucomicrobia bacterium]|nr:PQQ-binding-like beta-propeller repeat protein [Verrucomicrobiota bacterium]MCH8525558.1 PQQ-binding-like beta-propeller repeat protein [Kiritimatiellia bacterium]